MTFFRSETLWPMPTTTKNVDDDGDHYDTSGGGYYDDKMKMKMTMKIRTQVSAARQISRRCTQPVR